MRVFCLAFVGLLLSAFATAQTGSAFQPGSTSYLSNIDLREAVDPVLLFSAPRAFGEINMVTDSRGYLYSCSRVDFSGPTPVRARVTRFNATTLQLDPFFSVELDSKGADDPCEVIRISEDERVLFTGHPGHLCRIELNNDAFDLSEFECANLTLPRDIVSQLVSTIVLSPDYVTFAFRTFAGTFNSTSLELVVARQFTFVDVGFPFEDGWYNADSDTITFVTSSSFVELDVTTLTVVGTETVVPQTLTSPLAAAVRPDNHPFVYLALSLNNPTRIQLLKVNATSFEVTEVGAPFSASAGGSFLRWMVIDALAGVGYVTEGDSSSSFIHSFRLEDLGREGSALEVTGTMSDGAHLSSGSLFFNVLIAQQELFRYDAIGCASGLQRSADGTTCEQCPSGTFRARLDGEPLCVPCPPGTLSDDAAHAVELCTPCPAGTFASSATRTCVSCSADQFCPVASAAPLDASLSSEFVLSLTPEERADETSSVLRFQFIAFLTGVASIGAIAVLSFLLRVACYKKLQPLVIQLDKYATRHPTPAGEPIRKRPHFTGMVFFLFYVALAVLVGGGVVYGYVQNNERESRGLTLVTEQSSLLVASDFHAQISIYGGLCDCSSIALNVTGLATLPNFVRGGAVQQQSVGNETTTCTPDAEQPGSVCHLTWDCTGCRLGAVTTIDVVRNPVPSRFASSIEWSIETSSGVPGEMAALSGRLLPTTSGSVLAGSMSVNSISIVSKYTDNIHDVSGTGYWWSFQEYSRGESPAAEFADEPLEFSMRFERFQAEQQIVLTQKQSPTEFLLALLAGLTSLFGLVGVGLAVFHFVSCTGRRAARQLKKAAEAESSSSGKLLDTDAGNGSSSTELVKRANGTKASDVDASPNGNSDGGGVVHVYVGEEE